MTTEQKVIPAGYWESANGDLVPMNKIKPIDKDRHRTVVELCVQAKVASTELLAFKLSAMHTFNEFIARSLEAYDVKHGGMSY